MNKLNLFATTIEQSKRLIEAGIPDETSDMKYMWEYGTEMMLNFFKKKRADRYRAITRFEPNIGIICDTGDLEVLDVRESVIKDGDDLKAVYEGKDERVKIAITNVHRPDDIPAWSLTALLNLCPYGGLEKVSDKYFYSVKDYKGEMFETPIEAAVDVVCWFKEKGII